MAETRIRGIPEQHWREFKAICALEGKKINDKLLEIIEQVVEKARKGKS